MPAIIKKPSLLNAESVLWFFVIYFVFASVPVDVYAGTNSIKDTICKVATLFQGRAGRNVASLAVIIIGFGALMGKVSAGLCLTVCIGIAFIFGAAPIVSTLLGKSVSCGVGDCTRAASSQAVTVQTQLGPLTVTGIEVADVVGRAIRMIIGPTGKALATIAVVIVGLGALYGKISWPLAIFVGLGIALIFGSISIMNIVFFGCGFSSADYPEL